MKSTQNEADSAEHPFVFTNLERRTGDYLTQIREEAARIAEETKGEIARYREEAENELAQTEQVLELERVELEQKRAELERRIEEAAGQTFETERQKGYEAGIAEGRRIGYDEGKQTAQAEWDAAFAAEKEERLAQAAAPAQSAMQNLADQLGRMRNALIQRWEANVLQIAAAIAHQAIARELKQMPELPLTLLRESLELAVGCSAVKIEMNPDDLSALRPKVESLLKEFSPLTQAELRPDDRVSSGGCIVETSQGIIDQRIESRLERIIDELS